MNRTSRLDRRTSAITQSDVESGRSADRHRKVSVALFVAYVGGWALPLNASAEDEITLHSEGGIEVTGQMKVEKRIAVDCLEGPYAQQSLAVWRVDYSVMNNSGRPLTSVTAQVPIASPMPRCDKWSPLPKRFNEQQPVLWGDSVHTLHSSELAPNDPAHGVAFVLVSHDQQPRFGSPTLTYTFPASPCSEPAPLRCSKDGNWRLDPTVLLIGGRLVFDDPPDSGEIDPFKHGTVGFDLRLVGIEGARVWHEDKIRVGLNLSGGITRVPMQDLFDDSAEPTVESTEDLVGLAVFSPSIFAQINGLFRLEIGFMRAFTGRRDMTDGEDSKTGWFFGISFPLASDQIRKLVEKLW